MLICRTALPVLLSCLQLFGQRGKHDLVGLNLDFPAAMDFIKVCVKMSPIDPHDIAWASHCMGKLEYVQRPTASLSVQSQTSC